MHITTKAVVGQIKSPHTQVMLVIEIATMCRSKDIIARERSMKPQEIVDLDSYHFMEIASYLPSHN